MTGNVQIRSATIGDVPIVLRMIQALAEYEQLADRVVASEQQLRASLFGPQPSAEVVLADDAGEAVGFAVFFHSFSTFLGRRGMYLEDLFVLPGARGRGIGRKLFTHVARLALERGCGRMEWAVLDWNEPAIGFYTRMGAQALDDWTVYRLTGDALQAAAREM